MIRKVRMWEKQPMNRVVIIAGGGTGTRMGGDMPKQFLDLGGRPVVMRSMDAFYRWDPGVDMILVLPGDAIDYWKKLCIRHSFVPDHRVCAGGRTRFHSVRNALALVGGDPLVGIHDAVRPLVSIGTIARCFDSADRWGSGVPCHEITDTVRSVDGDRSLVVDRSSLRTIQTPQVFRYSILASAYGLRYDTEFTDDSTVVERSGHVIRLVGGNRENMKITTRADLVMAEKLVHLMGDSSPAGGHSSG